MRYGIKLVTLMLAVAAAALAGCGAGSSTTGTLSLAVTPQQTALNGTVTATATYSNPNSSNVRGTSINFSTNHPELFETTSASADTSGKATVILSLKQLTAATGPTGPVEVMVFASVGDLMQTATFTLKPADMTITPPPDKSFSVGALAVGSALRLIPSGMFVKVVDGNGNPVPQGTPVTVSVDNIVNGTPGDVIFWYDYPNGTQSAPANVITKNTDYEGNVPIQATIDIIIPSSKTQTISVIWKVSFPDPDSGAVIFGYATTMLSITP